MANTTNFGWETPDDTDLVKDGAAAMRTLGNSIDASFVDLKGGTTGQVLSKNSNTDLDFTWVAQDDSNAIQNAIVDAKGDLIAASAADTPARLAVGNSGETLVADSSATTGLSYQANWAAGKNKVINGDFNIWQRGTSFTNPAGDSYTADRFMIDYGTAAPTSNSVTRQTFTPGSAPVAGYEGAYFLRSTLTTVGTTSRLSIHQKIEDVRTFAGQTVTLSFWAKADSARTLGGFIQQNFGSGGSTTVSTAITSQSITTSWTRFSMQISVPSVSGKTIGTSSFLNIRLDQAVAAGSVLELWGVQLEAGAVATAFQTATGTLAGELAACQRYYYLAVSGTDKIVCSGYYVSATQVNMFIPFPVTMRTAPTLVATSGTDYYFIEGNGSNDAFNGLTIYRPTQNAAQMYVNSNVSGTAGYAGNIQTNNASASVAFNSEL